MICVVIVIFISVKWLAERCSTVAYSMSSERIRNCSLHLIHYSVCEGLCHKGLCRKCPEVSYDELACWCGQTVLQPPVPCGTPPPDCHHICNRTRACDHPVYHSCHTAEECPPCTHLVSKLCVGGHTFRSSVREILPWQLIDSFFSIGSLPLERRAMWPILWQTSSMRSAQMSTFMPCGPMPVARPKVCPTMRP